VLLFHFLPGAVTPAAFSALRRRNRRRRLMSWEDREDNTIYKVVVNHEEQYSIWPAHKENAPGWRDAGKSGPKQECLDYIKEVWTDMRPLSLRKKMEEMAQQSGQATN
jgi:MbtH protein